MSLAEKRQAAGYLQESYPVSERRACRVLQLSRSSRRRRPGSPSQAALVRCIHDLSTRYPRFGYRKIAVLLKQAGWRVGTRAGASYPAPGRLTSHCETKEEAACWPQHPGPQTGHVSASAMEL